MFKALGNLKSMFEQAQQMGGKVEEIKAQTKKVAEAEECLKVLEDNFNYLDRGGPIKPNGDYTWVRVKDDDE